MAGISPDYGDRAFIWSDPPLDGPAVGRALVRQRRRLLETVAGFGSAEWATQSRCEAWRARDVIAHLAGTDGFWALSMAAGRDGTPTRFLAGFDPEATPRAMVDATAHQSDTEVLTDATAAIEGLLATVDALGPDGWAARAEAPPGHLEMALVASHALWDGWVHERDILLPLGLPHTLEPDEVAICLRYAVALNVGFAAMAHPGRTGAVAVSTREHRVVADVGPGVRLHDGDTPPGALEIDGDVIDLVEQFSVRTPSTVSPSADHAWLLGGLAQVFTPKG